MYMRILQGLAPTLTKPLLGFEGTWSRLVGHPAQGGKGSDTSIAYSQYRLSTRVRTGRTAPSCYNMMVLGDLLKDRFLFVCVCLTWARFTNKVKLIIMSLTFSSSLLARICWIFLQAHSYLAWLCESGPGLLTQCQSVTLFITRFPQFPFLHDIYIGIYVLIWLNYLYMFERVII